MVVGVVRAAVIRQLDQEPMDLLVIPVDFRSGKLATQNLPL